MEIIDELEPTRRGPYAGATGYYGIDGRLDTCITLRTALLKDNRAYFQVGWRHRRLGPFPGVRGDAQ